MIIHQGRNTHCMKSHETLFFFISVDFQYLKQKLLLICQFVVSLEKNVMDIKEIYVPVLICI